jgi:hypothetical protein
MHIISDLAVIATAVVTLFILLTSAGMRTLQDDQRTG